MAFLNQQEREALAKELRGMSFNKAKGKLNRLDPRGRLAFYRNNQGTNQHMTRFNLDGLGTRVTLVEQHAPLPGAVRLKSRFILIEVIVEPTPDNRT